MLSPKLARLLRLSDDTHTHVFAATHISATPLNECVRARVCLCATV